MKGSFLAFLFCVPLVNLTKQTLWIRNFSIPDWPLVQRNNFPVESLTESYSPVSFGIGPTSVFLGKIHADVDAAGIASLKRCAMPCPAAKPMNNGIFMGLVIPSSKPMWGNLLEYHGCQSDYCPNRCTKWALALYTQGWNWNRAMKCTSHYSPRKVTGFACANTVPLLNKWLCTMTQLRHPLTKWVNTFESAVNTKTRSAITFCSPRARAWKLYQTVAEMVRELNQQRKNRIYLSIVDGVHGLGLNITMKEVGCDFFVAR